MKRWWLALLFMPCTIKSQEGEFKRNLVTRLSTTWFINKHRLMNGRVAAQTGVPISLLEKMLTEEIRKPGLMDTCQRHSQLLLTLVVDQL